MYCGIYQIHHINEQHMKTMLNKWLKLRPQEVACVELGRFWPGKKWVAPCLSIKTTDHLGSGMRFPCFTKLRLIDSSKKDDFLGLSTILIHRLWVSAVVREHVTLETSCFYHWSMGKHSPPNWGSQVNGCQWMRPIWYIPKLNLQ